MIVPRPRSICLFHYEVFFYSILILKREFVVIQWQENKKYKLKVYFRPFMD